MQTSHTSIVHSSAQLLGDYSSIEKNNTGSKDFYDVIAKYTYFSQGRLVLDHQYIHSRIMNSIDWDIVTNNINYHLNNHTDPNVAIAEYLEIVKGHTMGISSTKIMLLLRELYIAEGGKINICQVNVKNMNSRMKCCLPLTYLYEYGCFTNAETSTDNGNDFSSHSSSNKRGRRPCKSRSVVDKKYQVIIKALLKFSTSRNLFIMGSASDASNRHGLTSEPERWIVSMIRCHGPKMVAYFEKCVENLVRTYLAELEKQQRWEQLKQLNAFGSAPTSSVSLVAALRSILHDIVNLPGTKKRRQMKASEVNATAKLAMDSSVPSYESSVPVSISNDDVQGYSATSEPKSFEWLLSNISQKPIVGSDSTGSPVENNGDVFYNIIEPFLHQGSVDSTSSLDLPVSMPMHVPVSMVSSHEQLTILSELPAVSEVPSMAHVTNECRVDTTSVSFSPFESCIGAHQTSAIGLLDDLSRATYSWSDYGLN